MFHNFNMRNQSRSKSVMAQVIGDQVAKFGLILTFIALCVAGRAELIDDSLPGSEFVAKTNLTGLQNNIGERLTLDRNTTRFFESEVDQMSNATDKINSTQTTEAPAFTKTDSTTITTTSPSPTTTTHNAQELLIPPATINANIAQMHNVPKKKGQIIIR